MKNLPFLPLGLMLAASAALAQGQSGTVEKSIKFVLAQDLVKTVTQDGKTTEQIVLNPKTVLPGDVLREEVTVTNVSGKTLTQVFVGIPVPQGTVYQGQATPSSDRWKLQFSIDGGKTFSATPTRTVTVTENGQTVTRQVPAPPNTYTNVRWTVVNIKPDESLKLSFRVKVR